MRCTAKRSWVKRFYAPISGLLDRGQFHVGEIRFQGRSINARLIRNRAADEDSSRRIDYLVKPLESLGYDVTLAKRKMARAKCNR